jgi:protein O-GlcNAc transferase
MNNSFSQNVNIVFWDTSGDDYWSFFSDTWKVFSNKTPIHLRKFDGKRVCFKNAVFSLLARMRFGHFYNMPLVKGCEKTHLYQSFSKYVLHRLSIKQDGPLEHKIRITMLARGTQFRNVLNQDEIVKTIKSRLGKEIQLNLVEYDRNMPFVEQLRITYNSDIFMSMHGAGLTHLLFLPNWAAVFEIYNCEDKDCYNDLARLRGVKYFTWTDESKLTPQDEGKHPQLGEFDFFQVGLKTAGGNGLLFLFYFLNKGTPHKKFTNYTFDVDEFVKIVKSMIKYVKTHKEFQQARKIKFKKDEL